MRKPWSLVGLALLAACGGSSAQTPSVADYAGLISARSFKCAFPSFGSAEWDGDQPTIKTKTQDFGFHIDGVNWKSQSARLIGNAVAVDLMATRGGDSISFVERVAAGTLNVTTIYA